MHCLEYMLLTVSLRLRAGESGEQIADDVEGLAAASHQYVPEGFNEDGEEPVTKQAEEWRRRYGHLFYKS